MADALQSLGLKFSFARFNQKIDLESGQVSVFWDDHQAEAPFTQLLNSREDSGILHG